MNGEEDLPKPSDSQALSTPEPEGLPDNVIAFPSQESRSAPEGRVTSGASPPSQFFDAPAAPLTIAALEDAVRKAVAQRADLDEKERPGAADELVAQVVSALAGRDVSAALAEARTRSSAREREARSPVAPEGADRAQGTREPDDERTEAPTDPISQFTTLVREGISQFLSGFAERTREPNDLASELTFLRQQGPVLLGHLLQGLASTLLQPAKGPEPESPAPTSVDEPHRPEPQMSLGHLLKSLATNFIDVTRKPPTEPRSPDAAEGPEPPKLDLGALLGALFSRPPSR
jgi:hypothetical protein